MINEETIYTTGKKEALEQLVFCHDNKIAYQLGPFQAIKPDVKHLPLKSRQFFRDHPYFLILNNLKSAMMKETIKELFGLTGEGNGLLERDGEKYAFRSHKDTEGAVDRFKSIKSFCPGADYLIVYEEGPELFAIFDRTGKLVDSADCDKKQD